MSRRSRWRRTAPLHASGTPDYRRWQEDRVRIGAQTFRVATKPGVFAHGRIDPASEMLAQQLVVAPGEHFVGFNCNTGLVGAVALAAGAARVTLTDRNVLSWEAATRTLAANNAPDGSATALLSQGAASLSGTGIADVVAIRLPHERAAWQLLIADAFRILRVGGSCYLAGAVAEGIKPAGRAMEQLLGGVRTLVQGSGHRVLRSVKLTDTPADESLLADPFLNPDHFRVARESVRGVDLQVFSRPGVFSWEHLDEATGLLTEHMVLDGAHSVLDIGCGTGVIGTVAALLGGVSVCLVDADSEAVRCAARTLDASGVVRANGTARVLASDVTLALDGEQFDVVLSNPPFHVGKATDLDVPRQFIGEAFDAVLPGGSLQLVANRTLPYEHIMSERFGNVDVLHDGPRFKVLRARKRRD